MLGTATKCGLSSMAASNFSSPENIQESKKDGEGKGILLTVYFLFLNQGGKSLQEATKQSPYYILMAQNGSHCKPLTAQEAGEITNWFVALEKQVQEKRRLEMILGQATKLSATLFSGKKDNKTKKYLLEDLLSKFHLN